MIEYTTHAKKAGKFSLNIQLTLVGKHLECTLLEQSPRFLPSFNYPLDILSTERFKQYLYFAPMDHYAVTVGSDLELRKRVNYRLTTHKQTVHDWTLLLRGFSGGKRSDVMIHETESDALNSFYHFRGLLIAYETFLKYKKVTSPATYRFGVNHVTLPTITKKEEI